MPANSWCRRSAEVFEFSRVFNNPPLKGAGTPMVKIDSESYPRFFASKKSNCRFMSRVVESKKIEIANWKITKPFRKFCFPFPTFTSPLRILTGLKEESTRAGYMPEPRLTSIIIPTRVYKVSGLSISFRSLSASSLNTGKAK